jgi:xanthine dehydrogenase small subunit
MRELYLGYKKLDKMKDELLVKIELPTPAPNAKISFEKVSKRKCLDIATVNSAALLRASHDGQTFEQACLSVGGVAPIPLQLTRTAAALVGQPLTVETVRAALDVAQGEIAPISDVRGSAEYKRLLTRQLLIAHFTKSFPDQLPLGALLDA